uniref:peptidylamidoglycolate lyase n=1 Tax=Lygus hesperus TaxID=30085 RepID=A0A0K8SMF0_LYGHE
MIFNYFLSVLFSFSFYSSSDSALNDDVKENHGGTVLATEDWVSTEWLKEDLKLGQVGGITVDKNDIIYIFHRADRRWSGGTFNNDNVFQDQEQAPINVSTIIMVDKKGSVVKKLGEHMFYMPHGITVDHDLNIWVTDVALHQAMKFKPHSNDAVLIKGTRFIPGRDSSHFCKPSSIAVLKNGDFFVADGYCNSRIVKFDLNGKKILEWGRSTIYPQMRQPQPGEFLIPHALTLTTDESLLCVADRQNGRVQCFDPASGNYSNVLSHMQSIGRTVYSVAYSNYKGGSFVMVNGPKSWNPRPQGVVVSKSGTILHHFGSTKLRAPHDVAVSSNGDTIYVAEITTDGTQAWKFIPITSGNFPASNAVSDDISKLKNQSEDKGLAGAILITSACLIFSVAIVFSAFVYRRSRTQIAKDTVSLLPHSEL